MTPIDALPRGLDVERADPPQRRPFHRRNFQPPPDCIKVDAGRRPDHLHQAETRRKQDRSCEP